MVCVNGLHVELFRGYVLRSENGRVISDVTVLDDINILTYVQQRRGHVIGEVHGHFQKCTFSTSGKCVMLGKSNIEPIRNIGRMKVDRIFVV